MKFVIVSASIALRNDLSDFIKKQGYEVVAEARESLEALKMSVVHSPSHMIIDLEMPGMRGDEAAKKILALNSTINIILIVNSTDKNMVEDILEIGVKKILTIPVDFEDLKLSLKGMF